MRCVVAIVLLASALAAQTPEVTAVVSGIVKDSNGAPVAGVTVKVGPESVKLSLPDGGSAVLTHSAGEATTDDAGSYSIESLPPGTYTVKTERGMSPKRIGLAAGDKATLDFVVPANPSISGKVVDRDDNPAVDAFVWLVKPAYQDGVLTQIVSGLKVTGADGAYSFDSGLEVNRRYYVLVDRPPADDLVSKAADDLTERDPIEVPTYYPSATHMQAATTVILQPGENRTLVNVKIAQSPFYCVEGKLELSGKPSASNFVIHEAPLAGSRLARLRAYAGADGKYHACGLSPGGYRISTEQGFAEFAVSDADVRHVDLQLDTASPRVQIDWDGPSLVPDVPKMDDQAEALFKRLGAVMGMTQPLNDEDRRKLATYLRSGAFTRDQREEFLKLREQPELYQQMGNLLTYLLRMANPVSVMAKAVGSEFYGPIQGIVPAGDYTLHIQYPPNCYVKDVTYNDLTLADGIWRVGPAENGTLRVLMSMAAGELTVAVVDHDGKPLADAMAIVVPDSVTTVAALNRVRTLGKTDQNGSFSLRSLPPGKYRVLATLQPVRWDVPEDLEKIVPLLFQAKTVDLDGKAPAHVSLEPIE